MGNAGIAAMTLYVLNWVARRVSDEVKVCLEFGPGALFARNFRGEGAIKSRGTTNNRQVNKYLGFLDDLRRGHKRMYV
jgi:hypothetical protein